MLQPRNKRKSHLLTIGQREVETHGLDTGFWNDLYHRSVTVYWPVFFGSAAAIFVTLNAVFAFFYWLGDRPIANVSDDLPLSLFYFSIVRNQAADNVPPRAEPEYGACRTSQPWKTVRL